eukprot:CAMPEP_0196825032 /NCGR_PEP_ID=MMETSP1362-20130617/92820_1 /TAXON_ID=163516 /ORGANISM="Leptocylindrus danicus, Strain CCMP1856" /LENGTH=392 /DNA_ID=CAMNT_0042205397 /DNA_START=79 /DNA_END=1254 /DNA_ORIENTATION=-
MSHKRTKSDDKRFLAALAALTALDVEQNPNSSNTTQPASSSAAEVAGNIEGAQNQAHAEPNNASRGMSSQPMNRSHFKQNACLASINSINERSSIPETTETTELHYTQNPDFLPPSGDTIAERMRQKQDNLQVDSKTSTAMTEQLTDTVRGFRRNNELGLTRVQTLKQQKEYTAVTARHTVCNSYARGNELGLTRVETVKQQKAYRATTLQQNDALVPCENRSNRESAAAIIGNDSGRGANAATTLRPGVVIYVPNNDNVAEFSDLGRETSSSFNIPIAQPVQHIQEHQPANVHLVTDAQPLTPFYKQIHFWIILLLALIVGPTVTYLLVGRSENPGPSNTNIPTTQPTEPSSAPMGKPSPSPSYAPSSQPSVSLQTEALVTLYKSTNGGTW